MKWPTLKIRFTFFDIHNTSSVMFENLDIFAFSAGLSKTKSLEVLKYQVIEVKLLTNNGMFSILELSFSLHVILSHIFICAVVQLV